MNDTTIARKNFDMFLTRGDYDSIIRSRALALKMERGGDGFTIVGCDLAPSRANDFHKSRASKESCFDSFECNIIKSIRDKDGNLP
jgi:hypothetical protein